MSAYPSSSPSQSVGPKGTNPPDIDLRPLGRVFFWITIPALGVTFAGAHGIFAGFIASLWALACLSFGSLGGFLFGIPKTRQSGPTEPADRDATPAATPNKSAYESYVNTNLVEISDWLTKIIVGVGLIELRTLPGRIERIARILATSLGGCCDEQRYLAFAIAIVVAFTIIGFIFTYLVTRLYLSGAFVRADLYGLRVTRDTAEAAGASVESLRDAFQVFKLEVLQTLRSAGVPVSVSALAQAPDLTAITLNEPPASETDTTVAHPAYEGQLLSLAQKYNSFTSPSWEERVQKRDEFVGEMAVIINFTGGARSWIAQTALETSNVGLIAGLAAAMNAVPQPGDPDKIFSVADKALYKHARYKVATALGRLFEAGIAQAAHVGRAREILSFYLLDSDDSLRRRIRSTAAQISRATGVPVEIPGL